MVIQVSLSSNTKKTGIISQKSRCSRENIVHFIVFEKIAMKGEYNNDLDKLSRVLTVPYV